MLSWEDIHKIVIDSGALGNSKRQHDLLAYLLKQSAKGESDKVSAYSVAVDVFGRDSNFNPQTDSIVRTEMYRLRRNMKVFNSQSQTCKIMLEKGTFRLTYADNPKRFNAKQNRRQSSGFKTGLVTGLILMVAIASLAAIGYALGRSTPLQETFKASYSIEIESIVTDTDKITGLHRIKTKLRNAVARDFYTTVSLKPGTDYKIQLSYIDDQVKVFVFSKKGTYIWSKSYPVTDPRQLDIYESIAHDLEEDLFGIAMSSGNLSLYHAINPEISKPRRELFQCIYQSLTHTRADLPKFIQGNLLDCLDPDVTDIVDDKALIHVARADIYTQIYYGAFKNDPIMGSLELSAAELRQKIREELEAARQLSYKSFNYFIKWIVVEYMQDPIDHGALMAAIDRLMEEFSDSIVAKYVAAYVSGLYLDDWDRALSLIGDMQELHDDELHYSHTIYMLYYLRIGDYEKAKYHYNLSPMEVTPVYIARRIAVKCFVDPESDFSELAAYSRDFNLDSWEKYADYVRFRNFHPAIEALLLDPDVVRNCAIFKS